MSNPKKNIFNFAVPVIVLAGIGMTVFSFWRDSKGPNKNSYSEVLSDLKTMTKEQVYQVTNECFKFGDDKCTEAGFTRLLEFESDNSTYLFRLAQVKHGLFS